MAIRFPAIVSIGRPMIGTPRASYHGLKGTRRDGRALCAAVCGLQSAVSFPAAFSEDRPGEAAPDANARSVPASDRSAIGATDHVTAIIPAYNEADVIKQTVRAAIDIPGVSQVVVVDDASTDRTAEMAELAGAHQVVRLGHNLGKGGALNRGLQVAEGDVLLLLDADLGASASEAEALVMPVLNGSADMTIAVFSRQSPESSETEGGSSLAPKSGGFGLVVKTASLGIRLLTGKHITAPLCGQRALKREIVERTGGFASKFGVEVGLTIDALRMGCRVIEVPVAMVHRASGRDLRGFTHRGRQMVDVLRTLGRKALRI